MIRPCDECDRDYETESYSLTEGSRICPDCRASGVPEPADPYAAERALEQQDLFEERQREGN